MLVGYCRTSTTEQIAGFEAQHRALAATGCTDKIFTEQVSSIAPRPQLDAALDFVREGDVLVVTRLDRLARSTTDLLSIVRRLEDKKVALRILDFGGTAVDTQSPSGRLMLTMFAALAQFERELMLQRQKEGIAKAKAEGRYKGRAPTARNKAADVRDLKEQGVGATEIAERVGISRASVYRILAELRSDGCASIHRQRSSLRPYNGFTKTEREAASRIIERAIARGEAAEPVICDVCEASANETRIHRHLENYRQPLSYRGLCSRCHHHLHTRFWEPERWIALIEGKPRNWFHELSLDEASRTRDFDETYPGKLGKTLSTIVEIRCNT